MDMSVKAGGNATTVEQPKNKPNTDRRNSSDLDLWLEKAEAMGELKRITAEVGPDLEAAHITYLVGLEKSPALLFENIKGHPGHKALYNMIGCNLSRFCLMIGEEPVDHPLKAVQLLQKKLGRKMAPVEVPAAERDLQPEHRRRRQDRHPHVPGAADVAARRRHVSRHRRRRHHQGSGDRPRQRRHLPDDDQGPARDRRLHLAGQGRRQRPRQVVEDGQAGADRGGLRHRSAAVPGRRDEPAEDRERVRILFRHQGLADRAVHLRSHRPAAAGACRDHPRRPSLSGRDLRRRPVRRVHRLLRAAERRDALHARRARALPQQSDADLRADGRRAVERVRAVLGGGALRRHLGRPAESSACRASRACGRSPRPPAGA